MEFKFQSFNQRSSSSSSTFFSSSPLPNPNPTSYYSLLNHPHPHPHPHPHLQQHSSSPYFTPLPLPSSFPGDIMQREIEKERIRAEILAEEIMRRRALEEEVRREIMVERERFLRYGSTRIDSRVPLLTNFEETDRFHTGFSNRPLTHFGGSEPLPFLRVGEIGNGNESLSGVSLKEIKSMDKEASKEKVIILAKPNLNSTDLKRKTTPISGADLEVKSVSVKKQKTEDEWNCALCQITATSERGLNEHLQGKKHLARERGLVTQKMGLGVSPKPKVPKKTTANSSQKNKVKEGGKSSTKVRENPTQKTPGTEKSMSDEQKSLEKPARPRKFRLWCDICKVGAHTQKVMNSHTRGKKHLANFRKSNQPSDPVPEKKSTDNNIEENKASGFANVVAEAEMKVVDSDMPTADNKDKIVDNVADY